MLSIEDDVENESEVFDYLKNQDVAQLVDSAVEELVKERPTNARMWLASYFAGVPGCETLLGRLAAMEKEVRRLESINQQLTTGQTEEPIHVSEPQVRRLAALHDTEDDTSGDAVADVEHDADGGREMQWVHPPARIFEEYLKELDLQSRSHLVERPKKKVPIDSKSCLIVVDMQNDFMPVSAKNPDGGRFPVPEGDQCASNIVLLMRYFAERGGRVIATRDYHPHDHCSFINNQGQYPPHCVQGAAGSMFYQPISDCLRSLLEEESRIDKESNTDRDRGQKVFVAFKGFHEDVDSYGALPYTERQIHRPGALATDTRQLRRVDKELAGLKSNCDIPTFTGSYVLHASNMRDWDDRPDPNAPPDVLSFARTLDRSSQLQNTGGDKTKKCAKIADEVRTQVRKLYICGMALDYGVIDTAVSAALQENSAVQEVYIVLDATRPAYVPMYGAYGSGFLQSPKWLIDKLGSNQRVQIKFISTAAFLSRKQLAQLRKEHSAFDSFGDSEEPKVSFPQQLGPFRLMPSRAVSGGVFLHEPPTELSPGKYHLKNAPVLAALARFEVRLNGALSATSKLDYFGVERRRIDIPPNADTFCFAYPLEGAHHLTESHRGVVQCLHNANFTFAIFGGFLYLDRDGNVVGANALCTGTGLHFDPPQKWPVDIKKKLIREDRFQQVTFPVLIKMGCHYFVWIKPKEIKVCNRVAACRAHAQHTLTQGFDHGGFGYLMHEHPNDDGPEADKDVWFPMKDPTLQ